MDLEQLRFSADTTQLKQASDAIEGLAVSIDKVTKAERDRANIEAKQQAKAAKDNAAANLANARTVATAEEAERSRTKL